MRACAIERFGDLEQVQVRELPKPEAGPGELLVRVHAAAVNPADLKVLTHRDGGRFLHASKFPLVLGFDFAGTIEAVGPGVAAPVVGAEVFGFLPYSSRTKRGTFAEYVVAKPDQVGPKPKVISHAQAAAAATTTLTALQGLRDKGRLAAGQAVLIHGASGGVGSYAVQIAKALGATVTATASAAKAEYVQAFGADRVIDYQATPLDQVDGRFEVVFDVASKSSFGECAALLAPAGAYVTLLPSPALFLGMARAAFSRKRCGFIIVDPRKRDFEQASRWFDEGKLTPVLDSTYPLDDVAKALARLRTGDVRGKLAITIP